MTENATPKPEIRGPHAGEWFQVNSDPAYRQEVMLAFDTDGVSYLVAEEMVEKMKAVAPPGRLKQMMLFTAINQAGDVFLWPVPTPVPEQHIAYSAMKEWTCFPALN